jgi:hypothetical protein
MLAHATLVIITISFAPRTIALTAVVRISGQSVQGFTGYQ